MKRQVSAEVARAGRSYGLLRLLHLLKASARGNTLRSQVFRGGAWMGLGSLSEQGSRFIRNMILVRLLAPSAFGTMAIVISATAVFQVFTEIGAREALVQNPRGNEEGFVNAAWWMAFARALLTCIGLFLFAPWVARFYGNAQLTPLLRLAVFGLLLEGASSGKAYIAVKQLKLPRWAAISNGGGIIGVATTILLSFFIRNVWALVIGTCAESAARCVLSFILCPFVPRLKIDLSAAQELFKFSKGLFGLSILNYIFMSADIFVLGKLIPVTQLGIYTMGVGLAQVPAGFVIRLLGQIVMPTLSQVQHDRSRMNRIVFQVTAILLLLGMPALLFICFCGKSLITVIYGSRYAVAAPLLSVAAIAGLLNIANSQLTAVFYAAGAPAMHRRCVAAMAVTMGLLVYPAIRLVGPIGAQFASLTAVSVGYLIQLGRVRHFIAMKLVDYGMLFMRAAAISLCVALLCVITRTSWGPLPTLTLGAVGCVLAYGIGCAMWVRDKHMISSALSE